MRPSSRSLPRVPHRRGTRRALSYVAGPRDTLDERTLPHAWQDLLKRFHDRPALVSRHEKSWSNRNDCLRWSYSDFDAQINRLARGMRAIGIEKGDRVATWQGNSSANAALQWATAKIGAILVTLNPAYRTDEMTRSLNLVGAKALFSVPRLRTSDYATMLMEALPSLASGRPHRLQDPVIPSLRSVIIDNNLADDQSAHFDRLLERCTGLSKYGDILHLSSSQSESLDLHNDDVINLQYTSGTTAEPKAVMLTHRNILNNGQHIGARMRITEQDRLVNAPPLFHCFGLVLGNLALWTHGGCVIYANDTFDPRAVIEAVVAERATALHGVPTMFVRILETVEKMRAAGQTLDFSSLRTGIAAGSPVPGPLMTRLTSPDWLNLRELTIAFGQSETSPVTFQSATDDSLDKRIETVGRILPQVQAKVVDPITGETLPRGATGELRVAGYPLFKGYWKREAETQKVLEQDERGTTWLKTGDLASLDEDGFLSIRGRLKDLIIRGGENLHPTRIESTLLLKEDIADAAAVGVPDDLLGEVVGVFVRRHERAHNTPFDRQSVRAWVKEHFVQAAPAYVWFLGEEPDARVPSDWPLTTSGKVRKVELRALAAHLAVEGIGRVEPQSRL